MVNDLELALPVNPRNLHDGQRIPKWVDSAAPQPERDKCEASIPYNLPLLPNPSNDSDLIPGPAGSECKR